jgi:lipoate---protein ligase
MTHINLILFNGLSVFKQLCIEETLLRTSSQNWFLINTNLKDAIVLGCGCDEKEHLEFLPKSPCVIRRFSGGGSVYIDKGTVLCSFIFQKKSKNISFPEQILNEKALFYKKALQLPDFDLREHDFILKNRKCAGNALCIVKNAWLMHTSFLWECSFEKWKILKIPKQQPSYRQNRSHDNFIQPLWPFFNSQEDLIAKMIKELATQYKVKTVLKEDIAQYLTEPSRQTTCFI